tara:strand:- start:4020 stop:5306 length:1287 start_codon:yes stop_codon:yes gene_type:complete
MIYTIILILLLAILIESLLQKWVNFIRSKYDKSYNWKKKNVITNIITEKLDKNPEYSKEEFFIHSFYLSDDLLGTNNKPNTYNNEIRYKKNQEILTKYSIDKIGSRKNDAVFKNSSNYFSSYGDSLCFCRYVDDNKTWQYNLAKKLKIKVRNFGVGNHGLDQAFLKFKRNYEKKIDRPKKVIFLFGPETIRRNVSLWKHYYEFGNYLNFKPAFLYNKEKKKYLLHKIPKFRKKNFFDLKLLQEKIRDYDIFYEKKFLMYMWKRPYLFSLRKYGIRKIILLLFFTYSYLKNKSKFSYKFIENLNLYKNIDLLGGLYFDFEDKKTMFKKDFYIDGTLNIIKLIDKFCNKKKIKCHFVIVPTYYDLKYIKKSGDKYFGSLIDKSRKNNIEILSPLNKLIEYNCESIYADKAFGGHLNERGNKILANYLDEL